MTLKQLKTALFNNDEVLTPSMMIEKAVCVVDGAISAFQVAVAEIDKANEWLEHSKEESEKEIEELKAGLITVENTKALAEAKIESHLKLREKLSQFIQ